MKGGKFSKAGFINMNQSSVHSYIFHIIHPLWSGYETDNITWLRKKVGKEVCVYSLPIKFKLVMLLESMQQL